MMKEKDYPDRGAGEGDDHWTMRLWFNLNSGVGVHYTDWFEGAGAAIRYARSFSDDWQLYRRAPSPCILAESRSSDAETGVQ